METNENSVAPVELSAKDAAIIDDIRLNVGMDEADMIERTIRIQQSPK